jgi:hypothetical protein
MFYPVFLKPQEVVKRYRSEVSEGTLRNWRSMRIGPSFIKIGKAILYPLDELHRWERRNLVSCRPSRSLPFEEVGEARCERPSITRSMSATEQSQRHAG